jgi:tetratricopeptide (TPR) repeat protein
MQLNLAIAFALCCVAPATQAAAQPTYADARRLYEQTDYNGALKLIQSMPNLNAAGWELAGRCRLFLGDYKSAINDLEKAVKLDPHSSDHYMWLGRAWGHRASSSVFFMAVKYAGETRKNFEKAVELNPTNIEAINDLMSYYLDAPGFLGGGDGPVARTLELVRKADAVEYQWALSQVSIHRKDYDAAERQLRKAAEMAPGKVNRLVDLAKFLSTRGKIQESEAFFNQAAKLDPKDKRLLYGRAESYVRGKRNLGTAQQLLEAYLQLPLTPEDPTRDDARKLMKRAAAGGGSDD